MRTLSSLSISSRMVAVVILAAFGLGGLAAIAAAKDSSRVMTERKDATRAVVETALGVVQHFGAEADAGRMTKEEAQKAAISTLSTMRYNGTDYFWINDMGPTMIMHPTKPELDGTDLSASVDPDGKHLFVDMVNVVKAHKAGFVEYQWPKPGVPDPQPKVSYVAGYEPWGWVVGSGIYVDDVRSVALGDSRVLGLSALGILLLVGGVSMVVVRSIVRPIREATEVLKSGNIATRLDAGQGRTELDKLAEALNETLDRSGSVVTEVTAAVAQLDGAVAQLVGTSDGITRTAGSAQQLTMAVTEAAREVSSGIDMVASGADEMGASISEIAQNAVTVAGIAAEAVLAAEATTETVVALGDSSREIGNVVNVITAIAEQTNLLALNATIEAARAGEAGKGFAVVASEVKDLARETARATGDISERVESIQAAVTKAAGEIAHITQIIGKVNDYQATIAGAVEEQTATTAAMAHSASGVAGASGTMMANLDEVSQATQETTRELQTILAEAQELSGTSSRLQSAMAGFQV